MVGPTVIQVIAVAVLLTFVSIGVPQGACGNEPDSDPSRIVRLRQPVALVCADGGKTLVVANRRSGSVSVVDTAARRIATECEIGRGLAALALLPDNRNLLGVDPVANELLLLSYRDRSIQRIDQLKVAPDPIKVVVSSDGSSCTVASRWSRRLTFIALKRRKLDDRSGKLSISGILDLPFCPCEMAMLGKSGMLVVAEAFGGRLALVDTKRRSLKSVRSLPGHNIRGLALAPDGRTLLIAHQAQSRLAHSSFDDVHWGLLIRNHLRVLRTDALRRLVRILRSWRAAGSLIWATSGTRPVIRPRWLSTATAS